MKEGRYTLSELDRMRVALRTILNLMWVTNLNLASSYPEEGRTEQIESFLRTHMMNGTSAEELEQEASRASEMHDR